MYKNQNGYSLFELIVVLMIVGIIASIAMRSMQSSVDNSRMADTKKELDQLVYAISGNPELVSGGNRIDFGYIGDNGALPPNLDALVSNPGLGTWKGPYIADKFYASIGGNASEFKSDAWGSGYSYNGLTITSTGSGQTITREVAGNSSELFGNSASFFITDINFTPPGNIQNDSVRCLLRYPNGAGSITTQIKSPTANGYVQFDSLPIGQHTFHMVVENNTDTITKKVTIYPHSTVHTDIRYFADIWGDTTTSGGSSGGTSGSEILRPNGEGSVDQLEDENCSRNWQCVDESSSDGDGTFVKGDGNSFDSDLYATEDHTTGSGTIDSVVIHIVCRGPSGGKEARTYINTNGSFYTGSNINLSPISSYTEYTTSYINNPATGTSWTWSEIDAIEIGVEIRREGFCTQVWLEVFYTE